MTMNKKSTPPPNEKGIARRLINLLLFGLTVASVWQAIRAPQEQTAAGLLYAALVSVFLGILVWGFISSQSDYQSSVEHPKFRMLEEEEAEWKS